jgi:hypothetical protein
MAEPTIDTDGNTVVAMYLHKKDPMFGRETYRELADTKFQKQKSSHSIVLPNNRQQQPQTPREHDGIPEM